jgi:heme/copper-type cytochrome/quinol oxidase subunit 1
MAGMPRRIPDYPDAYENINTICSLGSIISVVSLFIFMNIIYKLLKKKV